MKQMKQWTASDGAALRATGTKGILYWRIPGAETGRRGVASGGRVMAEAEGRAATDRA